MFIPPNEQVGLTCNVKVFELFNAVGSSRTPRWIIFSLKEMRRVCNVWMRIQLELYNQRVVQRRMAQMELEGKDL